MENCTQVLDDSFFDHTSSPSLGRLKVGTLLINETSYDIFTGENVIGRDELSDIVLRSGMISSKHAVLEVEDWESHFLYDCGSTNKTRLNKAVLKPNVKYFLKGEEEIWFANFKAKYTKCEKPETVKRDEDSGSETGSESMLNCDSIDLADEEENVQEANPCATKDKPEKIIDESKNVADSFASLNSSSFVEEKKDSSSNQVVDGSIDDSTDDEEDFFIPPSQTVKEFKQKRFEQNKVTKVAEQICTEDIFNSVEFEKPKNYPSAKTGDCSKNDIFEAETQDVDVNYERKQNLKNPERPKPDDFDSQSLFETESAAVKASSPGDRCASLIFEAETQPLSVESPEKNISKPVLRDVEEENIFEAETQVNDVAFAGKKEILSKETTESIFEAETQINFLAPAPKKETLHSKQYVNTESMFEADTQINNRPQMSLQNKMENIYEAETQINDLGASTKTTMDGTDTESIFEAPTQVNDLVSADVKETMKKQDTENIFEAETQVNVPMKEGSTKEVIQTNVEDDIFEAATQVNVQVLQCCSKLSEKGVLSKEGIDVSQCDSLENYEKSAENLMVLENTNNSRNNESKNEDLEMSELVLSSSFTEVPTLEDGYEKPTEQSTHLSLDDTTNTMSKEKANPENENVTQSKVDILGKKIDVKSDVKGNNQECFTDISEEPTQLLIQGEAPGETDDGNKEQSENDVEEKLNEDDDHIADALTQKNTGVNVPSKMSTEQTLVEPEPINGRMDEDKVLRVECNTVDALTQVNSARNSSRDDIKVKTKQISRIEKTLEDALTQVNYELKAHSSVALDQCESTNKLISSKVGVDTADALTQVNESLKSKSVRDDLNNKSNLNALPKIVSDSEDEGEDCPTQVNPKFKGKVVPHSKDDNSKQPSDQNNGHCKNDDVDSKNTTEMVSSPHSTNSDINNKNSKLSSSQIAFCEQPTQLNLNILYEEDKPFEDLETQPVENYELPKTDNIEAEETQINIKLHKKMPSKTKLTDSELQNAETEPYNIGENKEPEESSDDTDVESESPTKQSEILASKDKTSAIEIKSKEQNSSKNFGFDESSTESDSILASVPLDIDEINEMEMGGNRNDNYESNAKIDEEKTTSEELPRPSQEASVGLKHDVKEETIAKSMMTVADMDICSTVGNVYVSVCESSKKIKQSPMKNSNPTLNAPDIKTSLLKRSFKQIQNKIVSIEEQDGGQNSKSTSVKKLFSNEGNALNDTLNQSIFFNQPCSSSTPFKVESNTVLLKSEQKTTQPKTTVKTPPREKRELSPLLPSTEELLAVADSPEIIKTPVTQKKELPLALKRTPRAKKPSRKLVESLEIESDVKSNDVLDGITEITNNKKPEKGVLEIKKKCNNKDLGNKDCVSGFESSEKEKSRETKHNTVEISEPVSKTSEHNQSPIKKLNKTQAQSACVANKNEEIREDNTSLQEPVDSDHEVKTSKAQNVKNSLPSQDTLSKSKRTKGPKNDNKESLETSKSSKQPNTNPSNFEKSSTKEELQSALKIPTTEEVNSDINSLVRDNKKQSSDKVQRVRPTRVSKRNHIKDDGSTEKKVSSANISPKNKDNSDLKELKLNKNKKANEVQEPSKKSRRMGSQETKIDVQNEIVSLDLHKMDQIHGEQELTISKVEEPIQKSRTVQQEKKTKNTKSKQSDTSGEIKNESKLVEGNYLDVGAQSKRKSREDIETITEAKRSKPSKSKPIGQNIEKSIKEEQTDSAKQSTPKKNSRSSRRQKQINEVDENETDKQPLLTIDATEKSTRGKRKLADSTEQLTPSKNSRSSSRQKQVNKTVADEGDQEPVSNTSANEKPAAKGKRKLTADSTESSTPTKSSRNKASQKQEEKSEEEIENSQTRSRRTRSKPARFRDDEESLVSDSGSERTSKRSGRSVLSNSTESIDSSVSESSKTNSKKANATFAKPARNSSQKKTKQPDVNVTDRSRTKTPVPEEVKRSRSRSGSQSSLSSVKSDASMLSNVSSPRRSVKRGEQVLFTGLTNPVLESNIKKLGGCVVESPAECSVLVTDKVRRTVKFLCVLAQGKPIVTPEWISHSWKCCRFEDPTDHLLLDSESQQKFSFSLVETMKSAKKQPLLVGYSVHATPSVKPPPEDIQSIVECCGGTYLKKIPSKWPEQSFVISSAEDKTSWKKLKVKNITPPIVATEMLLSGILQHRIDFQTHSLL